MRIAINGFGRIGKSFLRILLEDPKLTTQLQVVAINIGSADKNAIAHSFKYDTLMGTFKGSVSYDNNNLHVIDSSGKKHTIEILAELDPSNCKWGTHQIDWVVEATGKFTKRDGAQKHIDAGARAVLISAPAQGEDITIIPGFNSDQFNATNHKIVSLGSCTTNALVPMLVVLEKTFGIERAAMTTVHAYTNTQTLLDIDATSKDLRRSRAAALNIVPTTTGAMQIIGKLMPSLAGKITGSSLRVPIAVVSLIDLTVVLKKPTSIEELNKAYEQATRTDLKSILEFSTVPLVSSDYEKSSFSVSVDSLLTEATGSLCKIFGWYDNEWGYSERLKDFLLLAAHS